MCGLSRVYEVEVVEQVVLNIERRMINSNVSEVESKLWWLGVPSLGSAGDDEIPVQRKAQRDDDATRDVTGILHSSN